MQRYTDKFARLGTAGLETAVTLAFWTKNGASLGVWLYLQVISSVSGPTISALLLILLIPASSVRQRNFF